MAEPEKKWRISPGKGLLLALLLAVALLAALGKFTRPDRTGDYPAAIMVDGTGMCGGCRVTVGGEMKFACVDGPDFDGHKVDFDELMNRNSLYREHEAAAKENHACRLETLGKQLIQ